MRPKGFLALYCRALGCCVLGRRDPTTNLNDAFVVSHVGNSAHSYSSSDCTIAKHQGTRL